MADVIGYEEKRPDTLEHVRSGYPRFCKHFYICEVEEIIRKDLRLDNREITLFTNEEAAQEAIIFSNQVDAKLEVYKGVFIVHYPSSKQTINRFTAFIQHTGTGISSRQAEDFLVKTRYLDHNFKEKFSSQMETTHLAEEIAKIAHTREDNILICSSGMNAFYATFKAMRKIQRYRNRKIWIQLGWLYLDTIRILEKCLSVDEECIQIYDVFDLKALKEVLEQKGFEVAGVVTEIPTNPLIQSGNMDELNQLCREYGVALILDPTIASIYNVNILDYCDVLVTSLTKYAGNQGDIMAGCIVMNSKSPYYTEFKSLISSELTPLYIRDQARLLYQIKEAPKLIQQINKNTCALVEYLEKNKNVKEVFWAYSKKSKDNYSRFAVQDHAPGAMITISLQNISLQEFYDKIAAVKGPSFGTTFTILCPFMYLAHYDQVSTEEGRKELQDLGIDPDLIRISVGCEDTQYIIDRFTEVLGKN
jgi:cystathionine gamma-synthase